MHASTVSALLYKCDVLANEECSLCMNLNYTRPYLECFWCDGRCSYMNRCDQKAIASCPAPQILNVSCAALGEDQLQSEVRSRIAQLIEMAG